MQSSIVKAPEVKKVVLFKHGIAYYVLKTVVKDNARVVLQFKDHEMDDILKSLSAVDLSGEGYVSTIGYDASQDLNQVLRNVSISLPSSKKLLVDFLADLKGASIRVDLLGESLEGLVMGIDGIQEKVDGGLTMAPLLVILSKTTGVRKIAFRDIKAIHLLNPDLQKDLEFFLETIISRKQKDVKNLAIHCEASSGSIKERDIYLSYIQEAPVWKTSYRIVLPGEGKESEIPKGKALLSGWGLVENQTPNDWEEIDLTLVAGMPVTFRYLIYEPQFIQRKVVPLPTKSSIGPAAIEDVTTTASYDKLDGLLASATTGTRAPSLPPMERAREEMTKGFARGLRDEIKQSLAVSTKDMGELFEYHIAKPVSIERNQSALVPIVIEDVEAEKVLLYDQNIHPVNPMACAEVKNTTGVTLESGPVTLFIEDSLAGEAMLPFLNKDDTRLLNYALEQAVVVHQEEKIRYEEVHRLYLTGNYLYEYNYEDRDYTYKIRNKAGTPKKLYLDHPKMSGYSVREPPVEPKETANRWRFTLPLEPKKGVKFEFTMRREISHSYSLWDINQDFLDQKITVYVDKSFIASETRAILEEIAKKNDEKATLQARKQRLEEERNALNNDQNRLRENLKVLGTSAQEGKLKDRLVQKLTRQENRYEEIRKEIEDIDKKMRLLENEIQKIFKTLKL